MLKLTVKQLCTAIHAADVIERMEAAKDAVKSQTVRIHFDAPKTKNDPMGQGLMDYTIPEAVIRREVDERLAEAHRVLRDLGIELLPPTN